MELNFEWLESDLLQFRCNDEPITLQSFLCMIQFSFFREFVLDVLKQVSFSSFQIYPFLSRKHLSQILFIQFFPTRFPPLDSLTHQWNSFLTVHHHTIRICKFYPSPHHTCWLYSLIQPISYDHWNQIPTHVWSVLLQNIWGRIVDHICHSETFQYSFSVRSPFEILIRQQRTI